MQSNRERVGGDGVRLEREKKSAHLTAHISSMDTMMGGQGRCSGCSSAPTAAASAWLRLAARRPGCCFGSFRPHQRRQSPRLQTQRPATPCAVAKGSGTNCHCEALSGSTQPGAAQGPSRGMAEARRDVLAARGVERRSVTWHRFSAELITSHMSSAVGSRSVTVGAWFSPFHYEEAKRFPPMQSCHAHSLM